MIFPIGDDQVQGGYFPYISYAFIGFNILAFLFQLSFDDYLVCTYGSIPNQIINGQNYLTLFTSMFMHGGWMHLIGNMLFLWVFADNIEATVGSFSFLVFYVLGGLAASAAHIYFSTTTGIDIGACCQVCSTVDPCTGALAACPGSIPTVGASGSISAVLGAYLVMFPKSKVKILVIYFFRSFRIPAFWFLGFWIVQQLFSGISNLGPEAAASSGVAWWAHIGGFFFGVIAGFAARSSGNGPHIGRSRKSPPYDQGDLV